MVKTTALLAKYLGLYEKNPNGLVFAPLAESYRKLGMHKEAMDVLKKGLRHNPHYVLGLIVLAHCHFDQGNLEQSYRILSPIVHQEQDNLMLQKLFAQICYKMYAYKESLQAYKNVLYVNPVDEESKLKVKELEEQEENYYAYMKKSAAVDEVIDQVATKPQSIEEMNAWKSLDQHEEIPQKISQNEENKVADYLKEVSVDDAQAWTVKQWSVPENKQEFTTEDIPEPIMTDTTEYSNPKINLDSYQNLSPSEEIPIVTHTLIDIFCSQKHYDKALELLDKVLKNDPKDERSNQKRLHVISKMQEGKTSKTTAPATSSEVLPTPKNKTTSWNEAKYNMLSQRYGKLLDHLKELGKS